MQNRTTEGTQLTPTFPPPSSSSSSPSSSPSIQSTNLPSVKPVGVTLVGKSPMQASQQQQQSKTFPPPSSSSSLSLVNTQTNTNTLSHSSPLPSPTPIPIPSNNTINPTTPHPTTPSPQQLTNTQSKPLIPSIPSSSSSSATPIVVATPAIIPSSSADEPEVPSIGMYEEIEDNSSEILGFDELKGFGAQLKTQLVPQVGANLTISFPISAGIALSYASVPLNKVHIKKDSAEALSNPTLPPPLPYYIPVKSYYINAMLDPTQSLHLDYLHRYSPKVTWKVYGVTSLFEKDSTDLCGKLQYDKPKYNLQVKAATDNQYLGGSFLRMIKPNWYLGSELFFSNAQKSGGFSAGVQYLDKANAYRPQWTMTYNTMGDLTSTFTSALVPSILSASARFNFNSNNHESELGAGVAYTPKDLPLTVKARWDNTNRWGVMATLKVALGKVNFMATAGVSGGDLPKPSYGAVFSIEI